MPIAKSGALVFWCPYDAPAPPYHRQYHSGAARTRFSTARALLALDSVPLGRCLYEIQHRSDAARTRVSAAGTTVSTTRALREGEAGSDLWRRGARGQRAPRTPAPGETPGTNLPTISTAHRTSRSAWYQSTQDRRGVGRRRIAELGVEGSGVGRRRIADLGVGE
eukprot:2727088-Rhodomonas_salina.1